METARKRDRKKEKERAKYERRKLRRSALQRDITEPQRPTLLARRIARLPRRIPRAPTVLLRAKWLIIIIIILYFLRSSETTEKQKAREININKSSGHRTYRRTGERYPKMERANKVEKEGSEWRLEGEKEDTYIGKDGPREREEGER